MSRESKREKLGVLEEQLTTSWRSFSAGSKKFFKETGSYLEDALDYYALPNAKALTQLIGDKIRQTVEGGKELFGALRRGDWGIFIRWAKEDPLAVAAGVGAVIGVGIVAYHAITGLISLAGASGVTAWAGSGVTGILAKLKGLATLKGIIGLGSVGGLLAALTKGGVALYNFEWQETDEQIDKAIDQAITSLYEPMGEFLGRSLAGITVAGLTRPPRIEINVTQIALVGEINEDISDDLNDAVTDFIHVGMSTILGVAIKLAYKNTRSFIISSYQKQPASVKKSLGNLPLFGGNKLGESIENWGGVSSKPWSFKRWLSVDEKVEKIEDEKVKNLVEGFLEGFWDQWMDSVIYVSATRGA